jgi:hypothetical protein
LILSQLVVRGEGAASVVKAASAVGRSVGVSKDTVAAPASYNDNIRFAILLRGALHLFDNPSELRFHVFSCYGSIAIWGIVYPVTCY